ncbi:MAG: rhodanese-like domain-containing protein [Candidatus Bathyarchaeota archaeon]|nr:rhodanese-like domain-containing protein [Candidatus Bathyarchaeota archaeon]
MGKLSLKEITVPPLVGLLIAIAILSSVELINQEISVTYHNTQEQIIKPEVESVLKKITTQEAYTLIQDNKGNENFVILDVRTPEEIANGAIENSIKIDYYSDTFLEEIDELDKENTYLVYCRSGGRSGEATKLMEELGFQKVYDMSGGFSQWEAEDLPFVK